MRPARLLAATAVLALLGIAGYASSGGPVGAALLDTTTDTTSTVTATTETETVSTDTFTTAPTVTVSSTPTITSKAPPPAKKAYTTSGLAAAISVSSAWNSTFGNGSHSSLAIVPPPFA